VVNSQGIQIAYAGTFKLGQANYASAEWFQKAMQQPYFISDVFLGLRNQPHFIVTVLQHSQADGDWIIRATIDFEKFNAFVEQISVAKPAPRSSSTARGAADPAQSGSAAGKEFHPGSAFRD